MTQMLQFQTCPLSKEITAVQKQKAFKIKIHNYVIQCSFSSYFFLKVFLIEVTVTSKFSSSRNCKKRKPGIAGKVIFARRPRGT